MIKKRMLHFMAAISLLLLAGTSFSQSNSFSYGLNLGLNYPTIGSQIGSYAGEGNLTLGMFLQYKPYSGISLGHPSKNKRYMLVSDEFVRRLTYVLQPTFSTNSFRQTALDWRFTNNYLELSALVYIQPFTYADEFKFFSGIRPGLVVYNTSETIENGTYTVKTNPANKNFNGQIDIAVPFGVALELSPAVTVELAYNHSFTNANTESVIKGRSSFVELTLRLNAMGVINQLSKKEERIKEKLYKLHAGSLLVMLPTPNPSEIREMLKDNNLEQIEAITSELRDRNKKVIQEFKSYFDFCPVYFFMDTSAYQVVSKNFKHVFVNANLEVDTTIIPEKSLTLSDRSDLKPSGKIIGPDSSNFFVASFCEDISDYTSKHVFGLFVYDDKIIQLPRPFNVPMNLIGANLDGDPINFFRTKYYDYSTMSFERIITKFNKRLWRNLITLE
ncbi:MAG: hypothetical protein ACHQK8_01460 [Bacteroidia bacterium]